MTLMTSMTFQGHLGQLAIMIHISSRTAQPLLNVKRCHKL